MEKPVWKQLQKIKIEQEKEKTSDVVKDLLEKNRNKEKENNQKSKGVKNERNNTNR